MSTASRITSSLSHSYLEVLLSGDRAATRRVIDNALGTRRDSSIRVRIVSVATGQVFWSNTITGEQWNRLRAR